VGVLIPGLDKYAEVRAYAGFYHYENPFGAIRQVQGAPRSTPVKE
jgi:hypothetical protein